MIKIFLSVFQINNHKNLILKILKLVKKNSPATLHKNSSESCEWKTSFSLDGAKKIEIFFMINNEAYPRKLLCILRAINSQLLNTRRDEKNLSQNILLKPFFSFFLRNTREKYFMYPEAKYSEREKFPCVFLTNTKTRIKNSFKNINAL